MNPTLYIVSTPIGNYEDITLRALKVLKEVDFIICEEFKEAKRLLSHYNINKELFALNEHNEKDVSVELLQKIKEGKKVALISDCGTPLFSDPGYLLVQLCIESKIEIIPVPGANSLLPALVGSGFKLNKFYYAGWLSQKKELRKKELYQLKSIKELIVLMETPYRLKLILNDIVNVFGEKIKIALAFNLTLPTEKFFRGNASDILKVVEKENLKGEFVIIIDNRN
ncbi:MAG: 16S rRNA (cytidine(1402)-2'-O)-methyltransferase [Melioribacter sp.]|nr:16S rRNA (cytidine(1402)-2'-O)-methyltransferase [Melioribacter sp.]